MFIAQNVRAGKATVPGQAFLGDRPVRPPGPVILNRSSKLHPVPGRNCRLHLEVGFDVFLVCCVNEVVEQMTIRAGQLGRFHWLVSQSEIKDGVWLKAGNCCDPYFVFSEEWSVQ